MVTLLFRAAVVLAILLALYAIMIPMMMVGAADNPCIEMHWTPPFPSLETGQRGDYKCWKGKVTDFR